ncbi:MAG: hypothetical protein Q8S02_09220 [Hydrogenophaga sp.]|nr:hypothetical protein [Hydrogenophaga sp.]
MDSSLLIGLEMAGVLGLALAWGGYELWSLRKWRERDKKEREAGAGGDAQQASDTDKQQGR